MRCQLFRCIRGHVTGEEFGPALHAQGGPPGLMSRPQGQSGRERADGAVVVFFLQGGPTRIDGGDGLIEIKFPIPSRVNTWKRFLGLRPLGTVLGARLTT